MGKRTKRALAGAAVVAFTAGAGAVGAATEAWASIPASDGTIHGCYTTTGIGQGALYVIDSAGTCPTGYTELDWSQAGVSGYQVYAGTILVNGPRVAGSASGTVTCPAGKVALGAGFSSDVTAGQPTSDGTGWTYTFTVPELSSGDTYNFHSSITCATVGS